MLNSPTDDFARRHLGDDPAATAEMLQALGYASTEALIAAVPFRLRIRRPLRFQ